MAMAARAMSMAISAVMTAVTVVGTAAVATVAPVPVSNALVTAATPGAMTAVVALKAVAVARVVTVLPVKARARTRSNARRNAMASREHRATRHPLMPASRRTTPPASLASRSDPVVMAGWPHRTKAAQMRGFFQGGRCLCKANAAPGPSATHLAQPHEKAG